MTLHKLGFYYRLFEKAIAPIQPVEQFAPSYGVISRQKNVVILLDDANQIGQSLQDALRATQQVALI
jgi:hypothetical protein